MGIYYMVLNEGKKEYVQSYNPKCPEFDEEFCQVVIYAMKTRWASQDVKIVDDVETLGYYDMAIENKYTNVTQECVECFDFRNKRLFMENDTELKILLDNISGESELKEIIVNMSSNFQKLRKRIIELENQYGEK